MRSQVRQFGDTCLPRTAFDVSLAKCRVILAIAVAVNVFHTVWLLLGGNARHPFFTDIAGVVASLVSVPLCLTCTVPTTPRNAATKRAVWLLAGSVLFFAIGDLIWAVYEFVLRKDPPTPSLADVAYFLGYPFLFVAILRLAAHRVSRSTLVRMVLDGTAVMASFTTFLWHFLIGPLLQRVDQPLATRIVSIAYPCADIVLLFCIVALSWRPGNGTVRRVCVALGAGLMAIILADIAFAFQVLNDTYASGAPLDAVWPLGYLLIGLGAVQMNLSSETASDTESFTAPSLASTLAPYALVLPIVVVLVMSALHRDHKDHASIHIGAAVVFLLILARQVSVIVDNNRLNRGLHESQRTLSTLLSHLPGMAYRCHNDATWRMILASDGCQAITGYSSQEFVEGKVLYADLILEEDRDRVWNEAQQAVRNGVPFDLTYRLRARDGSVRYIWEKGQAVSTGHGDLVTIEGFVSDITEQRHLEQQMLRSEKLAALGKLAAGVVHEMNNPLAAISCTGQILAMHDDQAIRDQGQTVHQMAHRAGRIARSLLTFARQQPDEARQPCSLNACLEEALDLARYTLRKGDVEVTVSPAPNLPLICAHQGEIQQVVLNLLVNAEYALRCRPPDDRRVHVATEADNGQVRLSVTDNGCGMTEAVKARVFDPFYTTKEVGEGTGLGLSICHGIAEAHGGTLTVESEPGAGATFTLTLPA